MIYYHVQWASGDMMHIRVHVYTRSIEARRGAA
jgi:hypothetical protein